MRQSQITRRLKETKVLENYSFMTALSVLSALIGFIIYPYVVRIIGKETFGIYPYVLVWVGYADMLIDFGFSAPATKAIVLHKEDLLAKQKILSTVFTAKTLLFILSGILFFTMVFLVEDMRVHWLIYACAFLQNLSCVIYPQWYFQAMKNMRVVTYINLVFRLVSIPIILLLLHSAADLWLYALIVSLSMIAGAVSAVAYIRWHDGIKIRFVSLKLLPELFKEGTPFFMTGIVGQLKEGLMTIIIKMFFGYAEVTLYDIAKKLVSVPRLFTQNINAALFPEVMENTTPKRVNLILKYERIIGASMSILIMLFSYPIVIVMFGRDMASAWQIAAVLGWSIYTWLIAGAYLNFVFIPQNKYYYITLNQVVALVASVVFIGVGLLLWKNIMSVAIAITLSGFVEILFCRLVVKKNNLL